VRSTAGSQNEALSAMIRAERAMLATAAGALVTPAPRTHQILALQRTAGNSAVTQMLSNAPERTLARGKHAKLKSHKHKGVKHQQVQMNSSKMRFFRRLQLAHGGSRNIAMVKLTLKKKGGSVAGPKVVYILARSLGIGKSKITLKNEAVTTKSKTPKKRSHSEAVLRAVREIGLVGVGKRRIALADYDLAYAASTNEACGNEDGMENCADESVPNLGVDVFYYTTPYSGSADSDGTEKANNAFQKDVRNRDDESESESEDDYEAFVADDTQLRGLDVGKSKPDKVNAAPLRDYVNAGEKNTRIRYGNNYDDDMQRKPPKKRKKKP
jgi:hypothetical protein